MVSYYAYPGLKFKQVGRPKGQTGFHKPSRILTLVADFFDLKEEQLLSRNRHREIAFPRQVLMYFLRSESNLTFPGIARFLNMNHTTIITSIRNMNIWIQNEEKVAMQIEAIKNRL